jgi:ribonucleoside-diphosphate reductase alpha chain
MDDPRLAPYLNASSLDDYDLSDIAKSVFISKYALKDENGKLLEQTPLDMHKRMASEFHRIEMKYPNPLPFQDILLSMVGFVYIVPQGSPMAGIGNDHTLTSLCNCTVIGNEVDSIGGIMYTDQQQVQLMKYRAGVGHDLSHIRPRGFKVDNSCMTSTGITTFMERYSESTRQTAQDGRRGALMLTISVDHPDVISFVNAKTDLTKITGANISVKITDEFMNNVINNKPHTLKFPLINPTFTKQIDARQLWNNIIKNAHTSAEPGVLFWDKILSESPADPYDNFTTTSTNPCGEVPLAKYDSCRLLLINLYSFIENPFSNITNSFFNYDKFAKYINIAMRLLDDLIDLEEEKINKILHKIHSNNEPPEIKQIEIDLWNNMKQKLLDGRRTGLGITGEGDMIAAMGMRYASDESIEFTSNVHKFMAITAYKSSVILAKERGSFPIYNKDRDIKSAFIKRITSEDIQLKIDMEKYGRRNIAILTIAPTGSVSLLTGTSNGIEPVFAISHKRKRKIDSNYIPKKYDDILIDDLGDRWLRYDIFHKKFEEYARINNIDLSNSNLDDIYKASPYFQSSANDIDPIAKVRMQGEIQKWVDHSISVTVNVPKKTTKKMVDNIYMSAWKYGCKGCTIYRDGSRFGVLETKDSIVLPKKRPDVIQADVVKFSNNKEKWVAFIGKYCGIPYEIFTGKLDEDSKASIKYNSGYIHKYNNTYKIVFNDGYTIDNLNKCFDPHYWDYSILVSKLLRNNYDLVKLVELINGLHLGGHGMLTWKSGISRALSKYISSGTRSNRQCECGETYIYQEGCLTCLNCGNSKCN